MRQLDAGHGSLLLDEFRNPLERLNMFLFPNAKVPR
jgi:hypothetical protein